MGFTGIFHLLSHSIFLIWHHFYTISFDFGVTLILFTPNYTIDLHLHHSRYSFRQIHFWHLIFCMSHFSDMIVDILSDLRIRMFFAPLRSVLNGCPPDIQHPITYCITLGLRLFSPSLVHPVWRRVCAGIPPTSALLKKNSFESSSWVEPMDFTSNLFSRLRSLYTQ